MTGDGRIALGAAITFSVLYLFSALVVATPPAPDAASAEVQRYFVNHSNAIATSAWLVVAGTIPYLVFVAVLRRHLATTAGGWLPDLAFGGGLLLAATSVTGLMISLGLAFHPDFNPPDTVRVLVDVQRFFEPLATGAVIAVAAAVAVAAFRYDALPAWAGAASVVYALYEVIESATVFGGDSGGFAPGESVNTAGSVGFLVWSVAIGIALARAYPRGDGLEDDGQAD
jgi:hypothetical protein